MKWARKNEDYSLSYQLTGRKNGYKATITYSDIWDYYYFLVNKDGEVYNSLWDNLAYTDEDECREACEKYCAGDRK